MSRWSSIEGKRQGLAGMGGALRLVWLCALIAVVMLTGCRKESGVEPQPGSQGVAISFSGEEGAMKEMTRAETGLETKTHTFHVWGYKNDGYNVATDRYTSYQLVMSDYTVNWDANTAGTTSTNTNDWDYILPAYPNQTIKYWDYSAKAYRFLGYAIPTGSTTTVVATGGMPLDAPTAERVALTAYVDCTSAELREQSPYFSELWFSTGNHSYYPDKPFGQPVTLRFKLPFARVRFLFIYAEGTTITRSQLSDISFHPSDNSKVPARGNITVSYPLKGSATAAITEIWNSSVTGGVRDLAIDWYEPTGAAIDDTKPLVYPNSPEYWHYVLPIARQDSYTIEVAVDGHQVQKAVVPSNYMTWQPGYEYTYVFKISHNGEVTFNNVQVAINEWNTTGKTNDHTVHNW